MIIGLVGFAGAGKGTVADTLVEKYGFAKLSFADSLKDAASSIFGWERHLLEGDTDESRAFRETPDKFWTNRLGYDFTPRRALQTLGTEACRDVFNTNIWIYSLERKLLKHKNVVVADVRFDNEIDFIRTMRGFVVRVVRGPDPHWYQLAMNANHSTNYKYQKELKALGIHSSETSWIGTPFDYVLDNNGSKAELVAHADHMLKIFQGPIKNP
jgi:hypothetical protein